MPQHPHTHTPTRPHPWLRTTLATLILVTLGSAGLAPVASQTAAPKPEVAALLQRGQGETEGRRWTEALAALQQALDRARELKDGPGEAAALARLAEVQTALGRYPVALDLYTQARPLQRAFGDRAGEARTHLRSGELLLRMGRWNDAQAELEGARSQLHDLSDTAGEREAAGRLADVAEAAGDPAKALDYRKQAVMLAHAVGDAAAEAAARAELGRLHARRSEPREALAALEEALRLARTASQRGVEAGALLQLARAHLDLDQAVEAAERFQAALTLFLELKDPSGEAGAREGLGTVLAGAGIREKGEAALRRAAELYKVAGRTTDEARIRVALADFWREGGELPRARAAYETALTLLGDAAGGDLAERALLGLAGIDQAEGSLDRALATHERLLDRVRMSGNVRSVAVELTKIAALLARSGDAKGAQERYEQAAARFESAGDARGVGLALARQGTLALRAGEVDTARKLFEQSQQRYAAVGDQRHAAAGLIPLADLKARAGDTDGAYQDYSKALNLLNDWGRETPERLTVLDRLAQMELRRGEPESAERRLRAGGTLSDLLLNVFDESPEGRGPAGTVPDVIYFRLAQTVFQQERVPEAFAWVQRLKASTLRQELLPGLWPAGKLTEEQRLKEWGYRRRVARLHARLLALSESGEPGSQGLASPIREALGTAQLDLQRYVGSLYDQNPGLDRRRLARVAAAPELSLTLPRDTVLLEYFVPDEAPGRGLDTVVLFTAVDQGGKTALRVFDLQIKPEDLAKKAAAFRQACADPAQDPEPLAKELFRILLGPAGPQVRSRKRLLVCPDGPLWGVPFEALLAVPESALPPAPPATGEKDAPAPPPAPVKLTEPPGGRWKYLAEYFEIDYAASATAAQVALSQRDRPKGESAASALVLPGPESPSGATGLAAALHLAPEEPAAGSREAELKRKGGKQRALVFTAPLELHGTSPGLSGFRLDPPGPVAPDDGFLTAREAAEQRWPARVALMTGGVRSDNEARLGDGLAATAWAFTVAGVPSQLFSRWEVPATARAALLERVAREAAKGTPLGEALHEAELAILKEKRTAHPAHWAGFWLHGDWRKLAE